MLNGYGLMMFNVGKLNAIHLPFGDGFNRTNKNDDDLGMVYEIGVSLVSSEDHKLWRIRSTLHLKRKRHWLRLVGVYGTH